MDDETKYLQRRKNYFRDRIILSLILAAVAAAFIQAVPSLIVAIREKQTPVIVIDAVIYAITAVLFFIRKTRSSVRVVLILAGAYLLGVSLLWYLGPVGAGALWLMICPIFAVLLLDRIGGFVSLGINLAILAAFAVLIQLKLLPWSVPSERYAIFALNLLFLDFICIATISSLVRGFESSLQSERKLFYRLEANRAELAQEIDIRNKIEDVMKKREQKFRAIIECSSDTVCILDEKGVILYISGSVSKMLGWSPDELLGTELFNLIHPSERISTKNNLLVGIEDGETDFTGQFRMRNMLGEWVYCEAYASIMIDNPLIGGIIINLRDVSKLKTAEERAEFYQYYDPLTKLPNKQKFLSRLAFEINRAQYRNKIFAVMSLGIDKFKHINDVHGSQSGDVVLKMVGEDLTHVFREDDLVCRSRSDKFLILLSDITDSDHIREIIQKAQRAVSEPIVLSTSTVKITSSIGIAFYPHDGTTQDELISNAETAMYLAKEGGRNTYRLFDAEMNLRILDRMKLEDELADAIKNEEFMMFYQPKVTRDGRIAGAEALIRWRMADGHVRSPDTFIPMAERNGSIVEIGALVLRICCLQNRLWQREGYPDVRIAVNLSPFQFMHSGLIQGIKSTMLQTDLTPQAIELEITESGIMEDEKDSIRKLNELHEMGFSIAIDDFGTGYSSFSKLKDYPIDTLKIDKSFISSIPGNSRAEKITAAIVDLAHNLSFDVVAEGVETEAQMEFLERLHCDQYQGYYFSKPLPAKDFQERLKTGIFVPSGNFQN
jgi:diguanylate cyclase (GGDEF)-like protein/PAS domain S-box-containing protein